MQDTGYATPVNGNGSFITQRGLDSQVEKGCPTGIKEMIMFRVSLWWRQISNWKIKSC